MTNIWSALLVLNPDLSASLLSGCTRATSKQNPRLRGLVLNGNDSKRGFVKYDR